MFLLRLVYLNHFSTDWHDIRYISISSPVVRFGRINLTVIREISIVVRGGRSGLVLMVCVSVL